MRRLKDLPLRLWAIVPFTIILGAAAFRLSWNIIFSTASASSVLWGLAIGVTITGYFFLVRFLSRPIQIKKLKNLRDRTGAIVGMSAGLGVATAYLIQKTPCSIAVISKLILGLSIAVVAAGYFFVAFLIKPELVERVKTRTVRIVVTVAVTLALATLTIHTIRFLPSPEADHPFSQAMAILLLVAAATAHPLILRYIWGVWRREGGG